MKKLVTAILAVLYISTSTGATLHMHYCMGKLVEWGLWHNKDNGRCSKCGMIKSAANNSCCKDEYKFVKMEKDQKASESAFQLMQVYTVILPFHFFEIQVPDFPSITEENPGSHGPPLSNDLAVYIRNCVFRI